MKTALLSSLVALSSIFSAAFAQNNAQSEPNSFESCLLREVKAAAAEVTAAQIRAKCLPEPSVIEATNAKPVPASSAKETVTAEKPTQHGFPALYQSAIAKPREQQSVFERRMISETKASSQPFALLPHRPNYITPISVHERDRASKTVSGANQALESQFQVSFKFPLSRPLFDGYVLPFFAYTAKAWWQVYDGENSRPFREYNHEPEFLLAFPGTGLKLLGWQHRLSTVGFSHQSNGRAEPTSRSWNRITGEVYFDRGEHEWAALKIWHRLGESNKIGANDPSGDDNPDIRKFMGNFEFRVGHAAKDGFNLTFMGRQSLQKQGKGAVQLDWSYPIKHSPSLRWYVQAFSGYGDSLIDYNAKVNRLGLGIMLNDWF